LKHFRRGSCSGSFQCDSFGRKPSAPFYSFKLNIFFFLSYFQNLHGSETQIFVPVDAAQPGELTPFVVHRDKFKSASQWKNVPSLPMEHDSYTILWHYCFPDSKPPQTVVWYRWVVSYKKMKGVVLLIVKHPFAAVSAPRSPPAQVKPETSSSSPSYSSVVSGTKTPAADPSSSSNSPKTSVLSSSSGSSPREPPLEVEASMVALVNLGFPKDKTAELLSWYDNCKVQWSHASMLTKQAPRGYQKELFFRAMEQNGVIWLPTGSGKTRS
jgi:hypothetical protein